MILGLLAGVASAQANSGPQNSGDEILVRFRAPQNSEAQAWTSVVRSGVEQLGELQIVNESEGLVKVKLPSQELADKAKDLLLQNSEVLNLVPNLYYRPQVKYQIREVKKDLASSFLGLPFSEFGAVSDSAVAGVPSVRLPSGRTYPGVDPLASQDWAIDAIRLREASTQRVTRRIVAAVIDTGVDYNHEDLIRGMWRKSGNRYEVGYDFAHGHAKPFDVVRFDVEGCMNDLYCRSGLDSSKFLVNPGHGTHCAGHVAAVYNNSLGIRGVGAGSKLMVLKGFYDYGEEHAGQGDDAALIKSIDYAVKNGAKVISASWGGRSNRVMAEQSELKQALIRARQAGVLVVVAAGNDGINQDAVQDPVFPAAYDLDNLIVVGATDQNDQLAGFSNYGGESVHIAAPGVRILSTTSGGSYSDVIARFKTPTGSEGEIAWDGTSMATPIVAGAAALVWSKYPTENYLQIKRRILSSARYVPALQGKIITSGVLDVAAALE